MKTCTRCHIEKEDSQFKVRTDKRCNPVLIYLNNTCKKCDSEISCERSRKQRETPEGRAKHNKWANKFHARHREKCLAKMKERRDTPEYKAHMKIYREKRKETIYQQEVITKRKYHEKNRDNITDKYVFGLLRTQGMPFDMENTPTELLEIKKAEVALSRLKIGLIKNK